MRQRRRGLLRHAKRAGCDALVAFEPENLFYMTGFWGEAIGVLDSRGAVIIAPELEAGRAESESEGCEVVVAGRGSEMLPALAREAAGRKICTDCRDYDTVTSVKKRLPGTVRSDAPFYESRMVKDESEVAVLRKASRLIDELFGLCASEMRAGQRESELQEALMARATALGMFDTGYRSTLNPLIVAGGPNGALPHAQVTRRRFRRGDLVVVDITLRYRGYVSDATRTFAVGKAPDEAARAYETVREAQALGLRAVRAGARCSAVDSACRDHIAASGHGARFVHSTGHGIGLEVHEPPAVSAGSGAALRKNMAVTVEPGIYHAGRFGIRIEDSVLVRDRASVMHRFTKELVRV